jgi:hypothetical protein
VKALRNVAVMISLLVGTIMPSKADVLFQSIPDLTVATDVNSCSTCAFTSIPDIQVFDQFSLNTSATINSILFDAMTSYRYGSYIYQFPTYVQLSIWTVVPAILTGGQLGTLPGSQLLEQTLNFNSIHDTQYDTSVVTLAPTPFALTAGTYYISFYNPTDLILTWYTGGSGLSFQQGTANYPSGWSVGFALYGASGVPEPGTWALMLIGFASLAFEGFRRTNRQRGESSRNRNLLRNWPQKSPAIDCNR